MNYQKFPFGKYKGFELNDLPSTYIVYALEEFVIPDELQNDLKTILALRLNYTSAGLTKGIIQKTFRELSNKYHPDKGGSQDAFIALTDFKNCLIDKSC
jgi:uncharacterized protein (DUF3820 family)